MTQTREQKTESSNNLVMLAYHFPKEISKINAEEKYSAVQQEHRKNLNQLPDKKKFN